MDRLGKSTDLVNLEEESIAGLEFDGLLDAERVGDGQIITDNLEVRGLVEVAPCLPVILSKGILDADDWVLGGKLLVLLGKLFVSEPLGWVTFGVLEVQVVLLSFLLVELAGSNIHSDLHASGVASSINSGSDQLQGLISSLDIWGNTTLITDVTSRLAILLLSKRLELLVDLRSLAESLSERWCLATNR